nr:PREDICTED: bis(5'-adenosyl)-triphosphatase ENPP4 isoform X2 [Latimeria chalumnae]|eukprot:XP_005998880.1 PREDICTED: bis(5'-adenosyl)-triphosphatase ENPP4 isoform X2 [Latimeria chalumnae]
MLYSMFLTVLFIAFGISVCDDSNSTRISVPKLLLVSFDGFRADYLKHYSFPNLQRFIADGVLVDQVTDAFITKTFPNHYTLVTGLYEESHGIVANYMYDPDAKKNFTASNKDPFWWNEATPLWVTNQLQGHKSAAAMWPGTDVFIQNMTSSHYMKYDFNITFQQRVDTLIPWLANSIDPASFALLYWEEPDYSGHKYGPDNATKMSKALKEVDDHIGYLMEKLNNSGLWDSLNVIITSDHGMAQCSDDRLIKLDDCLGRGNYTLVDRTPVAALIPIKNTTYVYNLLKKCSPHLAVYLKDEIPDRFHYKHNNRIQPIILVAEEGWTIIQNGVLPRCCLLLFVYSSISSSCVSSFKFMLKTRWAFFKNAFN